MIERGPGENDKQDDDYDCDGYDATYDYDDDNANIDSLHIMPIIIITLNHYHLFHSIQCLVQKLRLLFWGVVPVANGLSFVSTMLLCKDSEFPQNIINSCAPNGLKRHL